ncbi:hypothetical protein HanPI659440_Chr06g0229061 [Helianthus annuus]|nr:hypothetical protein HanPI659440_Chr06g0229061 [Helianthus annuus]
MCFSSSALNLNVLNRLFFTRSFILASASTNQERRKVQSYVCENQHLIMEMEHITDFPMSTFHIGPRKLQSNLRRYDDHRTRHNGPRQHRRYQNWWFSDAVLSTTPKKWRNQEELSTKITMDFVPPENIQQCIRLTEEFCKLPVNHKAKEVKLEETCCPVK